MIEDYLKQELVKLDYLVDNTNKINCKNRFIRNLKLTGNFIKYHTCPFVLISSLIFGGLLLTKNKLPFIKDDVYKYNDHVYEIVNDGVIESFNYRETCNSYIDIFYNNRIISIDLNNNELINDLLNGDYSYIYSIVGNNIESIVIHSFEGDFIVESESDLNNITDSLAFILVSMLLTMMIPKDDRIFRYSKYTRNKELILYGHNDLDHKYLMNAKKIREDNLERLR